MDRIEDILQSLARQRGRGDASPLVLVQALGGTAGDRVTHVPISQVLYEAWLRLDNGPFRPHQSQALATLRRGEPLALRGATRAGITTARLLLYEALRADPAARGLLLLPNADAAQTQFAAYGPLNAALGTPLPVALVDASTRPAAVVGQRLLITTPDVLHRRLLCHHDRGWQQVWAGLRVICVGEAHTYTGVAGAHIAALLLRCARLRPPETPLQLLATMADVAGADAALRALWGQPWRVIGADDGQTQPTLLAVWRGGTDCLRDAATIAMALQRSGGIAAHISCTPSDLPLLRRLVGDESGSTTVGSALRPAPVQILAGYPGSHAAFQQALRSDSQATVLVLGEQMAEYALAQRPDSLLSDPTPVWVPPPANTYVFTQHLLCAASELPITASEVAAWQATEIVERMERHGRLARLPDDEPAWQPRSDAEPAPDADCYEGFGLNTAGSAPVRLLDEQKRDLGTLDGAAFDRFGFPGAALPPARARYRVLSRNEEQATLTLRPDTTGRRTYPLRRCLVNVREQRAERTLRGGQVIGWGRVTVEEEVYGYREGVPGAAPTEMALTPPLTTRWSAHGLWFDVGDVLGQRGQFAGWSLAAALPLRALAAFGDAVPAYSAAERRLYLVDAQPGGNGLAAWAFEQLEQLLELAYDIARDCAIDPLLEPLARADKDWLLLMLRVEVRRAATEAPVLAVAPPVAPAPAPEPRPVPTIPPAPPQSRPAPVEPPAPVRPAPPVPEPRPTPTPPVAPDPPAPVRPTQPAAPPAVPPIKGRSAPVEPQMPKQRPEPAPSPKPAAPPAPKTPRGRGSRRTAPSADQIPPAATPPTAMPEPPVRAPEPPAAEPLPPEPPVRAPEPPAAEPLPPEPPAPDANAMIARMRRLREERERRAASTQPDRPTRPAPSAAPVESRFSVGEAIFCLPYGAGIVRQSRIEDGQELLIIDFPDYGELTIDPSVSLVRPATPAG